MPFAIDWASLSAPKYAIPLDAGWSGGLGFLEESVHPTVPRATITPTMIAAAKAQEEERLPTLDAGGSKHYRLTAQPVERDAPD